MECTKDLAQYTQEDSFVDSLCINYCIVPETNLIFFYKSSTPYRKRQIFVTNENSQIE